ALLAAVDQRFRHANQLEAYLGLAPREYSSGETQGRGLPPRPGYSRTRWLLIQAAVSILRRLPPPAAWLRTGALQIAAHRGTQAAVVPPRPPPRREPLCPAAAMTVCLRHSSSPNEKEASQECVGLRDAIILSLTMGGAPEADGTATRT